MTPRVLVLGAEGMLGHQVLAQLRTRVEAVGSTRNGSDATTPLVDARDLQTVDRALDAIQPTVVVNCIGVVRQRLGDVADAIAVNAQFPLALAESAGRRSMQVVHISTDCVFSGRHGMYTEQDAVDPVDPYGMTKVLGEPTGSHVTTIRTTFVGRELQRRSGLLEWFLQQRTCRGFRRHFFSVMTTKRLGRVLASVIDRGALVPGLYHVAGPRVSKYEFLCAVRDAFELETEVVPDDTTACDRSLVGDRFHRSFGVGVATLTDIIEDLAHAV